MSVCRLCGKFHIGKLCEGECGPKFPKEKPVCQNCGEELTEDDDDEEFCNSCLSEVYGSD